MYNREHVFPAEISKAAFKKQNSNKIKFHSPINLPAQRYCATWCFFAHFRHAEWSLMEGVCVGAADGHPLLLLIWLTCVREGDADSGACRALYFQVQHWGKNP